MEYWVGFFLGAIWATVSIFVISVCLAYAENFKAANEMISDLIDKFKKTLWLF